MHNSRVFITGMSAITSVGDTIDATWNSILAGATGIEPIQSWDLQTWPHRLGGELKTLPTLADRKLMKSIARQDVMGIAAAMAAITHSDLLNYRDTLVDSDEFNALTAIYVGSPGNKYFQQYDFLPLLAKTQNDLQKFAQELFNEVHPMWLLRILPNNVLAYTGILSGFKGVNHNITNHAVSGMQALLEAYHAIKHGLAERAVVVAYDIGTEPQALFYYDRLGIISPQHLKPFDAMHNGTILADGACAVVLESEASMQLRDAVSLAEILGGNSCTEAAGLFSIQSSGDSLAHLLTQTLTANQLQAQDLAMLIAHGNGNPKSDVSEAAAINASLHNTPMTAFKWSMGHTLCASGLLDIILAVRALNDNIIPGIANLANIAATCAELNISNITRPLNGNTAMVINRGFASMNACTLLRK